MSEKEISKNNNNETLLNKIQSLENRLSKIESILRIEWEGNINEAKVESSSTDDSVVSNTESGIVEYGLAWLGTVVFLFGIIFLMSYVSSLGYPVLSVGIAYASAAILIASSYFLRNSFPILVNVLNICSPLLIYYVTFKLHFSDQALISQKGIVIALLLITAGAQLYSAIRKKSQFHGMLGIGLAVVTAIISDSAYITFIILTTSSLAAFLLFYFKLWTRITIFTLFAVYLTHLLWLVGNPLMGNPMAIVEFPQNNILFLFAYGVIFSLSILIPHEKLESNMPLVSISLLNAMGFSFLLILIAPSFYIDTYPMIFTAIAVYCIIFAVFLKLRQKRNFAPATYASFGFAASSVAIYGFTGLPDTYLLLVLQSLVVVSLALWFRSQIIVVANAFLFTIILLIFLITSESIDLTNFAFVITAFATARILGWQKERLTLKTEVFRNAYLIIATFMILYSLNNALPSQYVTFAWTATAIGFFLLSIVLHNIKYRYLSIFAFVVTGGHLFFIDLGQMEVGYRVIAFLVFAIISIGVSIYYTKRIRKK